MGAHTEKADEIEDPTTLVFDTQIFFQPAKEIKIRVFPQAQQPSQPKQLQHFVDAAEPRESDQVSRLSILLDEPLEWENGNHIDGEPAVEVLSSDDGPVSDCLEISVSDSCVERKQDVNEK